MKRLIPIILILFFIAGCSIKIGGSTSNDLGIYRSDDFGKKWQQKVYAGRIKKKELKISDISVNKIIPSPDKEMLYICTAGRGIYKSDNLGDIWQETGLKSGTYVDVAFDGENKDIIYTASKGRIYKSVNAGKNWDVKYIEAEPGRTITDVATDYYDSKRIYAATNTGAIIKSDDYGNTWQILNNLNTYISEMFFDPYDSRIIYIKTKNNLYISYDKGLTWHGLRVALKDYKGASSIKSISFNMLDTSEFYISTNYGILKTENRGESFKPVKTLVNFGTSINQVALDPENPEIIYIIRSNKFHKSINSGEEWETKILPTSGSISDIEIIPREKDTNPILISVYKNK
ncbi:MAG: hypothetical protein U5L76_02090 [Patescibacteria group bacterium]|nr:hypothetical protein [Patescibacteria group bacterium]